MDSNVREKQITRSSAIGILANVFLAAFKAVAGLLASSVSVILDAVNNLTDALSSVITIVAIKLARRKPDEKHPYGHGRIEYFSAIIISGIVIAAGATSFAESVKKIFVPETPDYSALTIIIISVAIIVKLALGKFMEIRGKKYNSDSLVAIGADSKSDAFLSASTLVGAIVALIWELNIDGYIGVLISVFIVKAGSEMLMESVGNIVGVRPDSGITVAIRDEVNKIDGVRGVHDLILHDYGPETAIGSLHIEVDSDMTARDIHKLIRDIQALVLEKFSIFVTVGIYSYDKDHPAERDIIENIVVSQPGVSSIHALFFDDEKQLVSFDALVDFSVTDKGALAESLKKQLKEKLPQYDYYVNFDTDYSN